MISGQNKSQKKFGVPLVSPFFTRPGLPAPPGRPTARRPACPALGWQAGSRDSRWLVRDSQKTKTHTRGHATAVGAFAPTLPTKKPRAGVTRRRPPCPRQAPKANPPQSGQQARARCNRGHAPALPSFMGGSQSKNAPGISPWPSPERRPAGGHPRPGPPPVPSRKSTSPIRKPGSRDSGSLVYDRFKK
jgi:hypothetical protein